MKLHRKLKNLKTLLIDDDEHIRDSLSLAFRRMGYWLQTAESAEEGLQALNQVDFDIIISDYRLPGLSGLTFLKQAIVTQPLAIKVLISSCGDHETIAEAYALGVNDFLQKPFDLDFLWATLAMHAEKRKGLGEVVEFMPPEKNKKAFRKILSKIS